jgi:hypothetical protein
LKVLANDAALPATPGCAAGRGCIAGTLFAKIPGSFGKTDSIVIYLYIPSFSGLLAVSF